MAHRTVLLRPTYGARIVGRDNGESREAPVAQLPEGDQRGKHRTVVARDGPSFVLAQGRGRWGGSNRGGSWGSSSVVPLSQRRDPERGCRDSPVPGRRRACGGRPVGAVQRARRDPGQGTPGRKRKPPLPQGTVGSGRRHPTVHPRQRG